MSSTAGCAEFALASLVSAAAAAAAAAVAIAAAAANDDAAAAADVDDESLLFTLTDFVLAASAESVAVALVLVGCLFKVPVARVCNRRGIAEMPT